MPTRHSNRQSGTRAIGVDAEAGFFNGIHGRLLICHRLARRDLIDSGRPGGHISGHSWEYMDRSCLAQFADGLDQTRPTFHWASSFPLTRIYLDSISPQVPESSSEGGSWIAIPCHPPHTTTAGLRRSLGLVSISSTPNYTLKETSVQSPIGPD